MTEGQESTTSRVLDPARLAAVQETGLLDTPAEKVFDDLARMAARLTNMPLAFVTLVDDRRSYWKAVVGTDISPDDTISRQNTLDESFCRYLVDADGPIVVSNAALDELTKDNPSIETMGVRAWAGYPVRDTEGHVLGSFCVVDTQPRVFSDDDLDILESLARTASREIALRSALRRSDQIIAYGEAQAWEATRANERLLRQAHASVLLGASLDAREVLGALRHIVLPELGTSLVVALPTDIAAPAFGTPTSGDLRRVTVVEIAHVDPDGELILRDALASFPLSIEDNVGVGYVIATGQTQYIPELRAQDLHFEQASGRAAELFTAAGVTSALTVPLRSRQRVLGAMTVTSPPSAAMDHELLADLGHRVGVALDNALAYGLQQRVGTELQRSLMPSKPPTLPGITIATRYLPSTTGALAGGDFHQVVGRAHDLVLVLGDVEGHGMASAARMGQLRAAVAALALEGHAPGALLERLAMDTGQILEISLATLLVAAFDPSTMTLTSASAGHPPAVIAEPGRLAYLADVEPGPPLGTGPARFTQHRQVLLPGSVIALYSDGLVERRGEHLDVGLERLRAAVEASSDEEDLDRLTELLLAACGCTGGGDDDIALLVVRREA